MWRIIKPMKKDYVMLDTVKVDGNVLIASIKTAKKMKEYGSYDSSSRIGANSVIKTSRYKWYSEMILGNLNEFINSEDNKHMILINEKFSGGVIYTQVTRSKDNMAESLTYHLKGLSSNQVSVGEVFTFYIGDNRFKKYPFELLDVKRKDVEIIGENFESPKEVSTLAL